MKIVALLLAVFLAFAARSQNTINNYRYALVPERFDFFKTVDQYGLNTLTKALLENVGFTAYMINEPMPAALAANKCSALKVELLEKKKFLATALVLILKDCQGTVVFQSQEGKSREKDWQAAYTEALRNAFASLNTAQYKYDSTTATPTLQTKTIAIPVAAPLTAAAPVTATESKDILYAQANANGYQLIDLTPKKVMTLLKTSQADYFIGDDGVSKGIVFRKNGEWFFEFYKEDKLVSQKLTIKF